jgi:predicted nucleic acid-binding protein
VKLARRQVFAFGTAFTIEETRETATELIRHHKAKHNAAGALLWYLENVRLVRPAPLGKQRSRDAKDDPYLAAALAARAKVIVSYDKDLLDLEKPFGIEIVRPGQFLKMVRG